MKKSLAFILSFSTITAVMGQCPQLFDDLGVPSSAPVWHSCSGTSFTLAISSPTAIGPFSIDWGDGTPNTTGAGIIPPQTVSHPYPLAVAQYTVTFTEVTSGCVITGTVIMEQSTSASIQIPVGGLTQICAPQSVDFVNSSTNTSPNTVFVWDFGDGTGPISYDYTNLGQTLTHTYQQGTVGCETTVQLSASNVCNTLQGGPSIATFNPIRVWDIDSAHISPSATLLCWPDNEVTYLNTTDRNCITQGNIFQRYEYWNFGNYFGLGHDSIIDWTPWPPTFPRTMTYPGPGSYTTMMVDSSHCGVDTAYVTINIVPPPDVTLLAVPDTICAGSASHFIQTTTGGANNFQWNWGQGGGFHTTGAGDRYHQFNTAGTYTVQFAANIQGSSAGCADTAAVIIEVLPSPTVLFTLTDTAACASLTTDPTNATINGSTYHWDYGDGTTIDQFDAPPHTYATAGAYIISLIAGNALGCSDTLTRTVNVYPTPQPILGIQGVCEGDTAEFTDLTVTQPGNPIIDWFWDFGDGATDTLQSSSHLYVGYGNYVITLTTTTPYCSGSNTASINLEPKPVAAFTADPDTGCSPMQVTFTNASTGAANYIWYFGDGGLSNDPTPLHTYMNFTSLDTTYTAKLVAGTVIGCSDTTTVDIVVAPTLLAMFTHTSSPGCAPLPVQFTNTSTGADSTHWDFGDGTTSDEYSPSHLFTNQTGSLLTLTVTLTVISWAGCTSTSQQSIAVYPEPNFTFTAQPDSGCTPLNVTFPSVIGAITYQWSFGDGTTGNGPTPLHTYFNNSDSTQHYAVVLVATNAFGCTDTAFSSVTVFPKPVAQLAIDNVSGCHPLVATLTNLSQGASSYLWSYGDGNTSDTSASAYAYTWYNYAGPGMSTYPVNLTATSAYGCTSTASAQVQVSPQVVASFLSNNVGCSPFDPQFTNTSTGAASYLWTFGDGGGSISVNAPHHYLNEGLNDVTFHAMLVATSTFGCKDTARVDILVHPAPIAQFTASPTVGCTPLAVALNDLTIGADSMAWQFGDGAFQSGMPGNASHLFNNSSSEPVLYNVQMVAYSPFGCTDTALVPVNVYPPVVAQFTLPTEACSPATVDIVDESTGSMQAVWDMGDGTMLVGAVITHDYVNSGQVDQSFTITLVSTSAYGCTDTLQQSIIVHPVPDAALLATPFQQIYPNATVDLVNSTDDGPWSYNWDLGDGETSTDEDPSTHTYATWGTFTITLVASNGACTDTASQQITIDPPIPSVSFIGSGEGCAPLTVAFLNTSLQGLSYLWDFGDGATSSATSPTYTYYNPGTYSVSLTAFGVGGGVNTVVKTDSVIVHPKAIAYFLLQPSEVTAPSEPLFTYNLSGNANSYIWDFGDGTFSNEMNPVHYYQGAGDYDVSLIANNQWNCPDTFSIPGAVVATADGEMDFPNAFTPGNMGPSDGTFDPNNFDNNVFHPMVKGVQDYHLQIFNRWGELIFESNDVKVGWDGYYRGQPVKQDVYVWKAFARYVNGEEKRMVGDVTLLR